MARTVSSRSAKTAAATVPKHEAPAAIRSGQRLSTTARRDVRWAMQQVPGDHVRDVTLHGVKITFNTNTNKYKESSTTEPARHGGASLDARSLGDADKPLNSRQRRSRARA